MKDWIVKSSTGAKIATSALSMILALLLFLITGDIFSSESIDKETSNGKGNTDITVNMKDTTQLSDIDKIMASQEIQADVNLSADNPYKDFEQRDSESAKQNTFQDERMAQMIKEQNEAITRKKASSEPITYERYDPPPYQRNTANRGNNIQSYQDDITYEKPVTSSAPKEPEKKRGFNTISSDNSAVANEDSRINKGNKKQVKAIVPVTQSLLNGSKVKLKLKEDFGEIKAGEVITGVARINQSEFNIAINGSQFGLEGMFYAYFNGIKGISFNENQINREITDEARQQGGNVASNIVRGVPILGDLGSRLISRVGESSRRREVSLELMSGERLTIGE